MRLNVRAVLATILVCSGLVFVLGCTQSEDIAQPQGKSTITLKPAQMPELDTLYAYELWMVKSAQEDDDFAAPGAQYTSLGKMTWDNSVARFRDMDGNAIPNSFELPESWFAYDYIALSVENHTDPDPANPSGTFMLVDEAIDQTVRPIKMKFPVSLFDATGFYFVGTPTNDTTYYSLDADSVVRVSEQEDKGLWLCSRFRTFRDLHDTLGVESLDTVMVIDTFDTAGRYQPDTVGIVWPPVWVVDTTQVVFGYDTLQHRRINIEWVIILDTMYDYLRFIEYNIDSTSSADYADPNKGPYPLGRIYYYEYSGPLAALPDIAPYGWRYNAWVLLDQPAGGANSGMDLAQVKPFGTGRQEIFTGENSWGVLSLGAFHDPVGPDVSNKYISNREVPRFPGEDFVVNANPRFDSLNFRRESIERWGSVVIGLEPDPSRLTIDSTTNFPLFILSNDLPSGDSPEVDDVHTFHNWTSYLPIVEVTVQMHD